MERASEGDLPGLVFCGKRGFRRLLTNRSSVRKKILRYEIIGKLRLVFPAGDAAVTRTITIMFPGRIIAPTIRPGPGYPSEDTGIGGKFNMQALKEPAQVADISIGKTGRL
jgi:hypothetical protein